VLVSASAALEGEPTHIYWSEDERDRQRDDVLDLEERGDEDAATAMKMPPPTVEIAPSTIKFGTSPEDARGSSMPHSAPMTMPPAAREMRKTVRFISDHYPGTHESCVRPSTPEFRSWWARERA